MGMLRSGRVTAPTVVLTLDDGYGDNVLRLRAAALTGHAPATLFVCSQRIDQQQPFDHDLSRGLIGFGPMTWDEARELEHWGFPIRSHTRTHFNCGSTDPERLHDEIVVSRTELETHLGRPIDHFSFPGGLPANISRLALELAQSTYRLVCSAYGGVNFPHDGDSPDWHVFRMPHPNSLLELELQLQEIKEHRQPAFWTGEAITAIPPKP